MGEESLGYQPRAPPSARLTLRIRGIPVAAPAALKYVVRVLAISASWAASKDATML